MTERFYLHPSALLHGPDAAHAVADGRAGWLAGGPVAYTQAGWLHAQARAGRCATCPMQISGTARIRDIAQALAAVGSARAALPGLDLPDVAVMGVVNVTPDSFSDGGQFADTATAVAQGEALIAAGADILDIGGESTRPGSDATPKACELDRVLPVIEGLVDHGVPISIDTRKAVSHAQGG